MFNAQEIVYNNEKYLIKLKKNLNWEERKFNKHKKKSYSEKSN